MIVFDRVHPQILALAYSIQGKTGSIWWNPTRTEAHFAADDGPAPVPEPATALLVGSALLALGGRGRGRPHA